MAKLSRKGDQNDAGGKIKRGASTVFANGKPVGLHVSEITPHKPFRQRKSTYHTKRPRPLKVVQLYSVKEIQF